MVAAHVWDTVGAQSAGMQGALFTRPATRNCRWADFPNPTSSPPICASWPAASAQRDIEGVWS